jgi:hypothetical protein
MEEGDFLSVSGEVLTPPATKFDLGQGQLGLPLSLRRMGTVEFAIVAKPAAGSGRYGQMIDNACCRASLYRGMAGRPHRPCQLRAGYLRASHTTRLVHCGSLIHQRNRGSQHVSIKCAERHGADIKASVGSIGDSYGRALAQSVGAFFEGPR